MMSEIMKLKIMEWQKDEVADNSKYLLAAKEISDTDSKAAGILRDIAKDEESHAKALDYILKNFT